MHLENKLLEAGRKGTKCLQLILLKSSLIAFQCITSVTFFKHAGFVKVLNVF